MSRERWQETFDALYPRGTLVEIGIEPGGEDTHIVTTPRVVVVDETADGRPAVVAVGLDFHGSLAVLVEGPGQLGMAQEWQARDGNVWLTRALPDDAPLAKDVAEVLERLPKLFADASDPESPHAELSEEDIP